MYSSSRDFRRNMQRARRRAGWDAQAGNAAFATATASTVLKSSYLPEYAVDGHEDSLWVPEPYLFPAWLALDFPQLRSIQGVARNCCNTQSCP